MAAAPAIPATEKKAPNEFLAPNCNFYQLVEHLAPNERAIVKKARAYMWTTPRMVAIAVGLEINAYACADVT
jgi:coenzyme PQQ precursor peptide PqqA